MNSIELNHELVQITNKFVAHDDLERLQSHINVFLRDAESKGHSTTQSQPHHDENYQDDFNNHEFINNGKIISIVSTLIKMN